MDYLVNVGCQEDLSGLLRECGVPGGPPNGLLRERGVPGGPQWIT